jgi:hypothetical protein
MTHQEISALEHASRAAIAWAPEGYDGQSHYRALMMALLPAAAILCAAAGVLARLLSA